MAQRSPIIQDGILTYLRNGSPVQIALDSSDWHAWLQTASTFTFRDEQGGFTAHKEQGREPPREALLARLPHAAGEAAARLPGPVRGIDTRPLEGRRRNAGRSGGGTRPA